MAGRFTNTNYGKTIDSLVQATKGVLNNPYYIHSNKKPTEVTYYKQNVEKGTTLKSKQTIKVYAS